jgi:hypothetical protein
MSEVHSQQLKDQLQKNQDTIAGLQQQNTTLQAQIRLLETHQGELKRATDGYPKTAADALQNELAADIATIAGKRKIAESIIKDLKDPIDKAIVAFDKNLDDQGAAAQQAADAATKAAADNDKAVETLRDRQSAYATLQSKPKAIDAGLKEVKALIDQTTKTEAQNDFRAMYFYCTEAEKRAQAQDMAVPTPDDYGTAVAKAQSDIQTASKDATDAKAAFDKATAAAADAKKAHDVKVAARQADLLAVVKAVPAPPPPAEPAPAAGGGTGRRGSGGAAEPSPGC